MDLSSRDGLARAGFTGFVQVRTLQQTACAAAPQLPGVYVVVRASDTEPAFLPRSVGGWFKEKDPTVTVAELRANWVPGAVVMYVGKAGGGDGSVTLRSRLSQYMKFGQGKPIGHWGGRLICQLADHADLLIAWEPLHTDDPLSVESGMIEAFKKLYNARPFANLKG